VSGERVYQSALEIGSWDSQGHWELVTTVNKKTSKMVLNREILMKKQVN
jgi:hypothetical protein